jgi:lipid-A-disaccharide synthase
MRKKAPVIAIVAGEISGDQLGGWLMEALKKQQPDIRFIGVGGSHMQDQGLPSLFPMEELSVIGFTEVLPHALHIKRRLRETAAMIQHEQPSILITIDSLGFNFRLNELLRKQGMEKLPKFVHYVAPTVWAYKAHRAPLTAQLMDMLLTILPFEPPYFEKHGLKTYYVGHQIAWWWKEKGDREAFRKTHGIAAPAPLLAIFPGSRSSELRRLLPLFGEAVAILKNKVAALEIVIQVPPRLTAIAQECTTNWVIHPMVISNTTNKKDVFAAADVALAKSGTIALECALAGLPNVIAYRVNTLTAAIVRRLLKITHLGLANILLKKPIIPELLQENCTPENIAQALAPLLINKEARQLQIDALKDVSALLGTNDSESPSDKAAAHILTLLD